MYDWIVFIHVLSMIVFFAAHGASMFAAFRIKQETDPDRLRAMLDVSSASVGTAMIGLIFLQLAGIVAGFLGEWWSKGLWIWISLGLILVIGIWMSIYTATNYTPLRKVLGMRHPGLAKDQPPPEPGTEAEIAAAVQKINPTLLAVVGGGLPLFILWMMIFKPF